MKTLQDFLNDLGARESGGNYKAFNKFGYAGKYYGQYREYYYREYEPEYAAYERSYRPAVY